MTNEKTKIAKSYFTALGFSLIPFFIIISFLYHLSISQHIKKLRSEHQIILELIKKDLELDFINYIGDVGFLAKSPQLKSLLCRTSNLEENKVFLESYLQIKDRYIAGDMKNNRNHIIVKEYYGIEGLNVKNYFSHTPNKKLTLNLIPQSKNNKQDILTVTAPIFHKNNEVLGSISLYSYQNSVFSILQKYKDTKLISEGDFFWFKIGKNPHKNITLDNKKCNLDRFLSTSKQKGFFFQNNTLFLYNSVDFKQLLPNINFNKNFSTTWKLIITIPKHEIVNIKNSLRTNYISFGGIIFFFYALALWAIIKEYYVRKFYENKLKNQNLQLLDSNKSKDRFISILAHDLKSPFTGITGIFTLLTNRYDSYDEIKKKRLIFSLNDSIQSIHSLLINLLEWSRLEGGYITPSPKQLKINTLIISIHKVLNSNLDAKNINFSVDIPDKTTVLADKNMIEAIFRNIISNAIKFTPNLGSIQVFTKVEEDFTSIYIKDSGIGMSLDIQSKLFNLNQRLTTLGTNQEKGTGLGLLITKEFINLNNGILEIKSILGEGTTFIVKLPTYKEI